MGKRILHSGCITYLTPKVATDYHMPMLPYPLLKHEVILMKKAYLPKFSTNDLGGYQNEPIEDWETAKIMDNHLGGRRGLRSGPKIEFFFVLASQELCINPTFCSIKRRCNWDTFERYAQSKSAWLNYPKFLPP